LLAAADLAKRNQIWDRAITAADKTKNEHDYSLRFLSPYGEQVRPAAQTALDDAVYGLMRLKIYHGVNRMLVFHLMQLMPAASGSPKLV
jgi:soluble lytic murein transglycosylase